ncbi:immediate early response 2b [Xyrichtys novacula]|uniref:Immediate early response 2b n=1 Tax=Xyrichtys novacula TaxID=13765 RepID=A0AAV1EW90_XYRNO|nr:immediate early response 2b [Xyrichtys novacula]
MEVNAEARRILAVSISKLYASRTQRGGLRLHRSLLLSLVMRSARDIYHSSRESEGPTPEEPMETSSGAEDEQQQAGLPEPQPALVSSEKLPEEPDSAEEECETTEDKENLSPTRQSRKRRGKASAAPDFLPSKRARLEPGEERYAAPLSSCRAGAGDSLTALSLNRGDWIPLRAEELTYIGQSQDKGITGAMVRAVRST